MLASHPATGRPATRARLERRGTWIACVLMLVMAWSQSWCGAQDPFAEGVRTTEPLSPEQERATFTLPPGFRIELVAAEPAIYKPMNLAFDVRGRLWVTDSTEYPYAAPEGTVGRDSVKILEDQDGDGTFETIKTFADGMNIPIGLYPTLDGCIVFGIPHIWYLRDNDGDDVADERIALYGPMGWQRDTHGMNNSFTRGFDGWLYACHGFNNDTTVSGKDGHTIRMQSGNTYRMRLDGQRVEQFTWGQVNPFGMTIDRFGNLFTADCHSKPVYQLVRGGYYPSFGKPHDGLGFVPPIMEHLHGSTAIAGVALLDDPAIPAPFRGNLVSGNVMTSRLNRNRLDVHGASRAAVEEPDFLATTDPWFRPVEVKLGPDGSIFVADFYNRIIGHYEVPLEHPGRDRERGRIWRIWYAGDEGRGAPRMPVLAGATDTELVEQMGSPNVTQRLLSLNLLLDRSDNQLSDETKAKLIAVLNDGQRSDDHRAAAAWALTRAGVEVEQVLDTTKLAGAESVALRVHRMRILSETQTWNDSLASVARGALQDESSDVRAAAADAIATQALRHPASADDAARMWATQDLLALAKAYSEVSDQDPMLRQAIRIAAKHVLLGWPEGEATPQELQQGVSGELLASVALAVPNSLGASLAWERLASRDFASDALDLWRHVSTYGDDGLVVRLAAEGPRRLQGNPDLQFEVFAAIDRGRRDRGQDPRTSLRDWGKDLAEMLLESTVDRSGWSHQAIPGKRRSENPWTIEQRGSSDGDNQSSFFTTLVSGEAMTGRLRSVAFAAPNRLTFWCAGHAGFPDRPFEPQNFVRLIDAESGEVLQETTPPRNDTAQFFEWDLSSLQGRQVQFEIEDGDEAGAYAWISVGRFEGGPLQVPSLSPKVRTERLERVALLVAGYGLKELRESVIQRVLEESMEPKARLALVDATISLAPDPYLYLAAPWFRSSRVSSAWNSQFEQRWVTKLEATGDESVLWLGELTRNLDGTEQLRFAERGVGRAITLDVLVKLWEKGVLSPRLLANQQLSVRIEAVADETTRQTLQMLRESLPAEDAEIASLITARRAAFTERGGDIERGKAAFVRHCAACHQIAGQGAVVGPQLDGIGLRGLERLTEDLLDPNRNVDVAFRATIVSTEDGSTIAGLVRDETDKTLVMIDSQGKEVVIDLASVTERSPSPLSLMPETLGRDLPEREWLDLVAYLLDQKTPAEK